MHARMHSYIKMLPYPLLLSEYRKYYNAVKISGYNITDITNVLFFSDSTISSFPPPPPFLLFIHILFPFVVRSTAKFTLCMIWCSFWLATLLQQISKKRKREKVILLLRDAVQCLSSSHSSRACLPVQKLERGEWSQTEFTIIPPTKH